MNNTKNKQLQVPKNDIGPTRKPRRIDWRNKDKKRVSNLENLKNGSKKQVGNREIRVKLKLFET